jgi:hypothetical protein
MIIAFLFCFANWQKQSSTEEEKFKEIFNKLGPRSLERYFNSHKLPEDESARGHLAITQWENGKVDPRPILIYAKIIRDEEDLRVLCMYFSDEDSDVAGFGIKEEHFVAGDKPCIVEETYPLFIRSSPSCVWISVCDIELRNEKKQKDERLWQEYINKKDKDTAEIKPPIIISLPEPNQVDVWIWLYDRAGNKSEPVKAVIKDKTKK